jgi:hypothetical protein
MKYYYNPEVKLLLCNKSEEQVTVTYIASKEQYQLPLTGNRPPYYTEPRYEQYYTKL